MNTRIRSYRLLSLLILLALLLSLAPAPSLLARGDSRSTLRVPSPNRAVAEPGQAPTYVDLRDHGPVPTTAIAFVGQPVVWTNNGTRVQTITEGNPIFRIYLPLLLRAPALPGGPQATFSTGVPASDSPPLFDSAPLAPGEQFTHTFTLTGTYTYYSTYAPGRVVGDVTVLEVSDQVSENVVASVGLSLTAPSGVAIEIGAGALLTDTALTVSTVLSAPVGQDTRAGFGSVYDMQFDGARVISDPITITLPYDPASLPPGTDERDLRAFYFDGLSWVFAPSMVVTQSHTVVFTTTHLSWWEVGNLCKPFGGTRFSEEELAAYDVARSYLRALSDYRDLFDVLTTSDGQVLFQVRGDEAKWLAKQRMCDLDDNSAADIQEKLGVNATAEQVALAMIALGQGLQAQNPETEQVKEIYTALTAPTDLGLLSLELLKLYDAGLVAGGFPFLWSFVVHIGVQAIYEVLWEIMYAVEIQQDAAYLRYWLDNFETEPVGLSTMTQVTGDEVAGHRPGGVINPCAYDLGSYNTFFRNTDIYGEYSFLNLYRADAYAGSPLFYVVGLQELYGFFEGYFDPVDTVLLLLEYESQGAAGPEKRVARLMFTPAQIIICPTGRITLPDARLGTEVKVTYYFIEDGRLSKKFDTKTWSEGTRLCYGPCGGENLPPNEPSEPNPVPGATDKDLDVDLSWVGGDPNGDAVTYDLYLEAANDPPTTLVSEDQAATSYDPGALDPDTHYFWRVVARDEHGATTEGPVWDFTTGAGINLDEMIHIAAGEFQMGCDPDNPVDECNSDEQPLHPVYLDAYFIDKYEVTNFEYKQCVEAGVCNPPHSSNGDYTNPDKVLHPVHMVNWYNANDYCAWVGKRLPTEAEWEKAARGTEDTRKFPWGNEPPDCMLLNYDNCVGSTTTVGSYPSGASPYGVLDMAGNVSEWVNDWYLSDYYAISPYSNPPGPSYSFPSVIFKASRDGVYYYSYHYSRTADRYGMSTPDIYSVGQGFRCAKTP